MNRFDELIKCFRRTEQPRCAIVDSNTTWEGTRYTEVVLSGDSMTIGGIVIPLYTEFLLCSDHEPKEKEK